MRGSDALFGQYLEYKDELKNLPKNKSVEENLPTFAATTVRINSPRWKSVPFILVSGKKLDKRESYIRIVFKDNFVCVSHCSEKKRSQSRQIVFHIGFGSLVTPSILVSKSIGEPTWPRNFNEYIDTNSLKDLFIYGEEFQQFYVSSVLKNKPAYQSVLANILEGKHEFFVNTQQLALSWRIWDNIVNYKKNVHIYESYDPNRELNFVLKENQLQFSRFEEELISKSVKRSALDNELTHVHAQTQSSSQFLGQKLVTNSAEELTYLLATEIDKIAAHEVKTKGSFHIALPGGQTMVRLFQVLAQSFSNIPWHSVHIWQVDERCVSRLDERSNFQVKT